MAVKVAMAVGLFLLYIEVAHSESRGKPVHPGRPTAHKIEILRFTVSESDQHFQEANNVGLANLLNKLIVRNPT